MKKFLIILLASPLILSASVAEYCMEKYSPDKEKDKFIQCVDDILEFSKNNEGLLKNNDSKIIQETYPSDKFNFLDPSALAMNNFSLSQKNEVLQIYDTFIQGDDNKAFVFSYNVNKFRIGDVYTWCTDQESILDANG